MISVLDKKASPQYLSVVLVLLYIMTLTEVFQAQRVNKISSEQASKCLSVYSDSTWTSNPARLKPPLTTVTPIRHHPAPVFGRQQCSTSLWFFMSWSSASFNLSIQLKRLLWYITEKDERDRSWLLFSRVPTDTFLRATGNLGGGCGGNYG